jgi:hypothetical protein
MPTDSDPSNSAGATVNIKVIKGLLLGRWPKLADLFTDENISNALLKVVKPDRLDSDGNYKPSARYLQTWSYDPVLRVEIKPDLFLIKEEIVRMATAAPAVN